MIRHIILSTLLLCACVAAAFVTYQAGWWRFNIPGADLYPVRGLDVSHHQGEIDWGQVPLFQYRFVYIKATEGGDWVDPRFTVNWDNARKHGFETGAYHFFTLCKSGENQADNYIRTVPKAEKVLPPAIDLEYVGNCKARPAPGDLHRELRVMADKLKSHYGATPLLYTTHEFYRDYLAGSEFAGYPLWLRDVVREPDWDAWPGLTLWQYGDNIRVSGIRGPVDVNARPARPARVY